LHSFELTGQKRQSISKRERKTEKKKKKAVGKAGGSESRFLLFYLMPKGQ